MCFVESKKESCIPAGGRTNKEERHLLKRKADRVVYEEVTLPILKLIPENNRPEAGWRWNIFLTCVAKDLRQEAKTGVEKQQIARESLKHCTRHESSFESNADRLESEALLKAVYWGNVLPLKTDAKIRTERRNVICEGGNATTANDILQNRDDQKTLAHKHSKDRLPRFEHLKLMEKTLGIATTRSQLDHINGVNYRKMEPRQTGDRAQIAHILHTTGSACNFLGCRVHERGKARGKGDAMCLMTGPEVVLQGNMLSMYDTEIFKEERRSITRLRSFRGIDVHLKLCEGESWTVDDFLPTYEPRGYISQQQDTTLSTSSGATTPTQSVRGASCNARISSMSHLDTLWDDAQWGDGNNTPTWGPGFFLLESESTVSDDQHRKSTGTLSCAEDNLQLGWAQAVSFTEALLDGDSLDEKEDRDNRKGISLTDEHPTARSQDTVYFGTEREMDGPFLASYQGTYSPCNLEPYANFLTDTNLIESIRVGLFRA